MSDSHKTLHLLLYAMIGLAGLALGLRLFFGIYQVHGVGMEPTLKNKELCLVANYPLSLEQGDLVVFRSNSGKPLVRRVIGLPKQKVEIKDSKVYINGQLVREPYVARAKGIIDTAPVQIPEDEYYLLSDDRLDTLDSRRLGTIHKDQLLGKIIY
ncbi:signal peptidase I [Laceyella sacchari]|uniref:Signal peptidase I n=1 Tax=Laceyella sacchari TaxID=37482 RepID=A0ABY5U0T6_LACSH|nr:signal peptidase I [Laceyella sacchari]TCW38925.1 signal peptidase I [Laceyella sacchari]UWE03262.1 signal peptidase I [Laceyella sacchari]